MGNPVSYLILSLYLPVRIGEFINYMEYVRNLQFEQKPNYNLLITMFKELYYKNGFADDSIYDWN